MYPLVALIWKNWLLFKRNWLGSLLVLLVPILFVIVTVIPIRNLFTSTDYPSTSFMSNSSLHNTFSLTRSITTCKNTTIGLAPNSNSLINQLASVMVARGLETRMFGS
jgi:hypothetical protein